MFFTIYDFIGEKEKGGFQMEKEEIRRQQVRLLDSIIKIGKKLIDIRIRIILILRKLEQYKSIFPIGYYSHPEYRNIVSDYNGLIVSLEEEKLKYIKVQLDLDSLSNSYITFE